MQLRATHSRGRASPSHNIRTLASGEDILRNRDVSTPKRCSMQHEATYRAVGAAVIDRIWCASKRVRFWLPMLEYTAMILG